jgi:hypothetical protein
VIYIPSSSAIANQESLSGLEVEMRKLEGIVKEIVDEMGYLEEREQRFANTNSKLSSSTHWLLGVVILMSCCSLDKPTRPEFCLVYYFCAGRVGNMADFPPQGILQAEIPH